MAETGGFGFIAGAAGVFGVVLGWALSLIGFGRKIEQRDGKIASNHTRITELGLAFDKKLMELENDKNLEIADLEKRLEDFTQAREIISRSDARIASHDQDIAELRAAIKDVLALFKTGDDEPRFITRPACLGMQDHCHAITIERDKASLARFGNLEQAIKDIKKDQENNLETLIKEIRKVQK
jgi:hypothetical protein